jgi:hypothetical protein
MRKSVAGCNIGRIAKTQELLDFCGEHGITAATELKDSGRKWSIPMHAQKWCEISLCYRHGVTEVEQRIKMEIKRSDTQSSTKGRTEYFTGTVYIDPLFQANIPARSVGASVTFEHSARTA